MIQSTMCVAVVLMVVFVSTSLAQSSATRSSVPQSSVSQSSLSQSSLSELRPSHVQAAFDAMEAADESKLGDQRTGHMGRKVPVMKAISKYQDRIAAFPTDTKSQVVLGQLYLRLAKETGSHAAYKHAEKHLRQALELKPESQSGLTSLAASLESQHRFREALEIAWSAYQTNPSNTQALAICGDCQLQLGGLKACREIYETLSNVSPDEPAVIARLAHLAELTGESELAITHLKSARERVSLSGKPLESIAWYSLRLGAVYKSMGQHEAARLAFMQALQENSNLIQAKIGVAEMLVVEGQLEQGVLLLEEAISEKPSAAALVLLADILESEGKPNDATPLLDQAEALLMAEMKELDGAHQRQLSRFYSDHARNPTQAVRLAKQDLLTRADIYSHDTLAWALFQNGQFNEAAAVMPKALAWRTQDASLHYHAAVIFHEVGDDVKALAQLLKVERINSKFHPTQAKEAAKLLATLQQAS